MIMATNIKMPVLFSLTPSYDVISSSKYTTRNGPAAAITSRKKIRAVSPTVMDSGRRQIAPDPHWQRLEQAEQQMPNKLQNKQQVQQKQQAQVLQHVEFLQQQQQTLCMTSVHRRCTDCTQLICLLWWHFSRTVGWIRLQLPCSE